MERSQNELEEIMKVLESEAKPQSCFRAVRLFGAVVLALAVVACDEPASTRHAVEKTGDAPGTVSSTVTPQALAASMGYEILHETGSGDLVVRRQGREVWAVRAYMITHQSLHAGATPDRVELRVETRETRRAGTDYRVELGPDGARLISETPGAPTGIERPVSQEAPKPN
jgi:hypothetical protein